MASKKLTGNRIFILVIVAVLLAFTSQLGKIPEEAKGYPTVLIACSFLFCIYLFVKPQQEEEKMTKESAIQCLVYGALLALSIYLMTKIGYILSTLLFMYASMIYLKIKNRILLIVFPIVMTLLMYFLFKMGLNVFLPEGAWFSINL